MKRNEHGWNFTSTTAVNRGYWDPEESTRTKWTTTYATELDARNLTHDFTGLSSLLIGYSVDSQFGVVSEGKNYYYGSWVSDDGNYTSITGPTSNSNAEMPRSDLAGNDAYGAYYNYYAATAESGKYDRTQMTNHTAEDSVCPKGWKLPSNDDNVSGGWGDLFVNTYQISTSSELATINNEAVDTVTKSPFSMSLTGIIETRLTRQNQFGYFWTSGVSSSYNSNGYYLAVRKNAGSDDVFIIHRQFAKHAGVAVRCVKK